MASTTAYMGAPAFWNAGFTGAGVDVAVIDSGVMPVAGLDGPDKIVYGPDLSFESQAPELRDLDTFGHGTFMAGLIAAHDAGLVTPYASAPASQYRGVAPDARILSVKVATADGGADVSQVIAAIDWVVQHRNDNGMNVRVLNLSYAVNSVQDYQVDPLIFAVEQAWKAGIFVTSSAGNDGYLKKKAAAAASIGSPARSPMLVAVGASDSKGTPTMADDKVPSFSASGGLDRGIDLVTPGTHLQGLRVPGSFIDTKHPEGEQGDRYFRGSGTSQSAAMLAGAAALVIQQRPGITPDQLKALFTSSTVRLQAIKGGRGWQGNGELDLARAFRNPTPQTAGTTAPASVGTGSIELARGTDHISEDGVPLTGEFDIFGTPFDAARMAPIEATHTAWTGGTWNGNEWTGTDWTTGGLARTSWTGRSWTGRSWTGRSWTGRSWSGRSWTGRSWTGRSWTGRSWTSELGSDGSLSGAGWSGDVWATGSWG
jgi:serine protease AprX